MEKKKTTYFIGIALLIIATIAVCSAFIYIANADLIVDIVSPDIGSNVEESEPIEVTQEEIDAISPIDEEGAKRIGAIPRNDEDDTWAIYIYLVGADLESGTTNNLSQLTKYQMQFYSDANMQNNRAKYNNYLTTYLDEIYAEGMDLPSVFYNITPDEYFTSFYGTDYEGPYLQALAQGNIEQILSVSLPENIKVVIQTGGATAWADPMINPNRSQRFVYDSEGFRKVYDSHIANMADSETLSSFLQFCKSEYDADHTMLVLWGHGSGSFGYGNDMNFYDSMSLATMRKAFEDAFEANEDDPAFDIICFNSCLMANLDVCNALRGFGKYMLASEELIYLPGIDYKPWLEFLSEDPGMSVEMFAKYEIDSFISQYAVKNITMKGSYYSDTTMSLIDLSATKAIGDAYNDLIYTALEDLSYDSSVINDITSAVNRSVNFYEYLGQIDLKFFMDGLHDRYPDETDKVLEALDNAVLYHREVSYALGCGGLTVYYPETNGNLAGLIYSLQYINEISNDEIINAFYYYKTAGCLNDHYKNVLLSHGLAALPNLDTTVLRTVENADIAFIEDEKEISISLDEDVIDMIQDASLYVYMVNGDEYMGLGEVKEVRNSDNALSVPLVDKWFTLDGELLFVQVIDSNVNYIRYMTDIVCNFDLASLIFKYYPESGRITIDGIIPQVALDTNDNPRIHIPEEIEEGSLIAPVNAWIALDGSLGYIAGIEVIFNENSRIELTSLPKGEYIEYIQIYDARGGEYESPTVDYEIKDSGISLIEAGTYTVY